jgi:enoyl-CoA hydratase
MLKVERDGGVLVWTIKHPTTKNALDRDTMDHLLVEVTAAAQDKTLRAIVLTGHGDTFVSGGNLNELKDASGERDAEQLSDVGYEVCTSLEQLGVPVIAALPGAAIGGGAELALACDMRIADERARISFKQARLGVTPAWGSVPRLVATVGASAAARLLFTAHEIPAAEAKAMGLVDEVSPDGTCLHFAMRWANDVCRGSPRAIALAKALLREARQTSPDLRALERERFVATWTGPDHAEAMAAFFEKRAPVWNPR